MQEEPTTSGVEEPTCFDTALDAINELEVFVSLCWEGLGFAEVAREVAEVLKESRARRGDTIAANETRMQQIEKLEGFAAAQKPLGFPYLYGLATIRLWTILEAFAEDLFIELITAHPELRSLPKVSGLKGPLVEFSNAPVSRQAELLFDLLTGELAASLKRGVGRFECIFDAIGLAGPVDDQVRRCFVELQEIRNVVAHRRGIADDRIVTNCPWYGAKVGESIQIPPAQFRKYILSAHWYLIEISRRILNRFPPESNEFTKKYASRERHEEVLGKLLNTLHANFGSSRQS